MRELLQSAMHRNTLRAVDYHFARHMETLAGEANEELVLAAALASHRVGEGDVCVDLAQCGDFPLFQAQGPTPRVALPPVDEWVRSLRRSSVVGQPGERAPLILDGQGRLYLGRYWHFERSLADAIAQRIRTWVPGVDHRRLRQGLDRLFPANGEIDWQRVAAAVAVLRPLCVISGGPGTGKTRTVTSILALLMEQADGPPPRLALAAPTGKAAARLTESIRGAKAGLKLSAETAARIPEEAVTLHRLLGFRPGRANPRYGRDNPLHLDLLVVDEASMVDLPLMARLFEALPPQARVILLGDKDQLASVEAGMVLGDICGRGAWSGYSEEACRALNKAAGLTLEAAPESGPAIADHIVVLRKSWRFREDSGIGALARAVNRGDEDGAIRVLEDGAYPDVSREDPSSKTLSRLIMGDVIPACSEVLSASDPESALRALNRMRVLCAVREGPYGVRSLNRQIELALVNEGLIERAGEMYAGRPVMMTTNDHAQRLYNGDVGLVLADPASRGALRVFVETAEGVRRILPSRLPPHETVYAMTVHKSQGSEFNEVLMVLPDAESRVLTRELLYTGITRAQRRVSLLGSNQRFRESVTRRVRRSSGLRDALWGAKGDATLFPRRDGFRVA
jgi:exodeoxyribonuclease V alpha subunit